MLNLKQVIDGMYEKGTGEEQRRITIVAYKNNNYMFYQGELKWLYEYTRDHDELNPNKCDNVFKSINDLDKWEVVEILVDDSWEDESNLPDYNKGKIISII